MRAQFPSRMGRGSVARVVEQPLPDSRREKSSMSSRDPIVAAVVEKYRGDPTYLVQILREAQEALDWIAPETAEAVASQLRIPPTQVQSALQFYSFLYDKPRGRYRLLFSDNITDRMLGNLALLEHMLQPPEAEARRSLGRRPGQRRSDVLHRHVRPGAGAAGQQSRGDAPDRAPRRRNLRPRPRARPLSEWPADYFRVEDNIRRADKLLGGPYAIGQRVARGVARGREGMLEEMKRSNLRGRGGAGFATGGEMGGLPQRARRRALRRLQRRRGRARHVQGPRAAAVLMPTACSRAWRSPASRSARARAWSICAANIGYLHAPAGGQTRADAARTACWAPASAARRASISTSKFISAPAPMSAARNRR